MVTLAGAGASEERYVSAGGGSRAASALLLWEGSKLQELRALKRCSKAWLQGGVCSSWTPAPG